MPELPEVETVVRNLSDQLVGRKICTIDTFYPKIIKTPLQDFTRKVVGKSFVDIERFGKYILLVLDDDMVVRVHLRMEGKFYITETFETPTIDKHVHLVFGLDDGRFLKYHDVRKFGTFEYIRYQKNWNEDEKFKTLGYEPWETSCTPQFVHQQLKHSKKQIKPFLLDQKTIVGLGNIYVDEVLFRAKIHPETLANKLSKKQAEEIINASKSVMEFAISLGGSTIRTYHNTLGIDGLFQNELQVHLQAGEKCKKCGTEIKKIKVSGRGTYICEVCQKVKK